MMFSPRFALTAAAAVVALSAAPAVRAETLADVVAYAYANNPGIQSQRAALRALDESYVQARGGFGPNISATGSIQDYELRRARQRELDAESETAGISLTQPLFTSGRLTARLRQAEARVRAGREQLRRAELDLLLRVVNAYMNVRRDEQLVQIGRDTVEVLTRSLADTEAKARVRVVTATDVSQSRARLAQAQTQLFALQEQLASSRAVFLGIVGRNPGSLEPPPKLDDLPLTPDEAINAAEANSPQLLAAQYTEQASRARVGEAKAQGRPSVSARLDIAKSPFQPYDPEPYDKTRSATFTLSQPLFTSGQIRSGVRQAVEENNRDRLAIDDNRLQVLQLVVQSWERLVSLRRQLGTLEEEVRSNQVAFFGVRAEETYALRSNIEVLNAAAELNQAQQNLVRTRAAEYVSRVQLLAATGTLTPKLLSAAAEPYDPAENFRRVQNKGATPLEWPGRLIDGAVGPRVERPRPATIPIERPSGSSSAPTPGVERPITSILEIIKTAPRTLPPAPAAEAGPAAPGTGARDAAPARNEASPATPGAGEAAAGAAPAG